MVCEQLEVNWLVFTAGTMGAGKGYVLQWLNDQSLFPLDSFVLVDPDRLREQLPETCEYVRRDPQTAGYYTQKEVGYISEVLTLHGLKSGKNVLVDGSLRDADWYVLYTNTILYYTILLYTILLCIMYYIIIYYILYIIYYTHIFTYYTIYDMM